MASKHPNADLGGRGKRPLLRRRYVKREPDARGQVPRRVERPDKAVVHVSSGITITGAPSDVEDFLDAREIDRRLADPANQERIPWREVKASLGI
jgi:hypothetical protein